MKCSKCGCELINVMKDQEILLRCPNCGLRAVTTCMPPILDDLKKYSIIIESGNELQADILRLFSKLSGKNILESRKLLIEGGIMITDLAVVVKEISEKLNLMGVVYRFDPDFPYTE